MSLYYEMWFPTGDHNVIPKRQFQCGDEPIIKVHLREMWQVGIPYHFFINKML